MPKLLIIKTNDDSKEHIGDFTDQFLQDTSLCPDDIIVWKEYDREPVPGFDGLCGAVISGSTKMVTDQGEAITPLVDWIREAYVRKLPVLGVCFGHQALAYAMGGQVGNNPGGTEFGTAEIALTAAGTKDPLLSCMKKNFLQNVAHTQSVLVPPEGATVLAESEHEVCHSFRLGSLCGIQFHPEFKEKTMLYISEIMPEQNIIRYPIIEQDNGAILRRFFIESIGL